ncbi:hypothetical protein D3C78_1259740 [compost metagenome]
MHKDVATGMKLVHYVLNNSFRLVFVFGIPIERAVGPGHINKLIVFGDLVKLIVS